MKTPLKITSIITVLFISIASITVIVLAAVLNTSSPILLQGTYTVVQKHSENYKWTTLNNQPCTRIDDYECTEITLSQVDETPTATITFEDYFRDYEIFDPSLLLPANTGTYTYVATPSSFIYNQNLQTYNLSFINQGENQCIIENFEITITGIYERGGDQETQELADTAYITLTITYTHVADSTIGYRYEVYLESSVL